MKAIACLVPVLCLCACSPGGPGAEPDADADVTDAAPRPDAWVPNVCGNGRDERGEVCDGLDLDGVTCGVMNAQDGEVQCTSSCELDFSDCAGIGCGDGFLDPGEECDDSGSNEFDCCQSCQKVPECGDVICGDGVRSGAEECDQSDLGGMTCADLDPSWTHGPLLCRDCRFNIQLCQDPNSWCGDGILEAGEQCDDGNLLSGDGCSHRCKDEAFPASEPNDTPETAGNITNFTSEGGGSGSLFDPDTIDMFALDVPAIPGGAGWHLSLWTSGFSSGQWDLSHCGPDDDLIDGVNSVLRVRRAGENVDRAYDDDGGDGTCSHVRLFVEPGRYYISVTASRIATASTRDFPFGLGYSLSLACHAPACDEPEPNDTAATASSLTEVGRGGLTVGDVDTWAFGGAAGVYRITQQVGCDRTTTIELFAPDGVTSLGSTDGCGVIVRDLPAETHFVRVRNDGHAVPEYRVGAAVLDDTFVAETEPNDTPGDTVGAPALPLYHYLHGRVDAGDPIDHVRITVPAATRLHFIGTGTGARCETLGLRLFTGGGATLVATGAGKIDNGLCGELAYNTPAAGTYVLEITGSAEGGAPLDYEIYREDW